MDPYHIVSDANSNVHTFYRGNNETVLQTFEENKYDLIVTSPPYADLLDYSEEGFIYNPDTLFPLLYKVLKQGGRLVWVVGDKTKDFDMEGQPFAEFFLFKKYGFRVNEIVLYLKKCMNRPFDAKQQNAHFPTFEYIPICSKDKPKTFNPLKDRKTITGKKNLGKIIPSRKKNGDYNYNIIKTAESYTYRRNVWEYTTGGSNMDPDFEDIKKHPATFPLNLACDLIKTYSDEKMFVLDPFGGSGTVSKASALLNRRSDYIDISQEYFDLALERMADTTEKIRFNSRQKQLNNFF